MNKLRMVLTGLLYLCCVDLFAQQVMPEANAPQLLALCYHDVVAVGEPLDGSAVSVDTLVKQFSWLAAHGYQPISLRQWRNANGPQDLPPRPVLLTFDDGYASFSEYVLPLLELFNFPAVLAPVTSWINAPVDQPVLYGDELVPRDHFLTWPELQQISESGLVEIVSHTHDMHNTKTANPFGNQLPAVSVHAYDERSATYEPTREYRARIQQDLQHGSQLIRQHLGQAPDTVVWPYGAYNEQSNAIAADLGMTSFFTLDPMPNTLGSQAIHRYLISSSTDLAALVRAAYKINDPIPLHAAYIDMDEVYSPEPAQAARNLDALLDRIKAMQIGTVFLKAFADIDSDGLADELYFPNGQLPTRADLLSRVSWQLRTRAEVRVYVWMPVFAFDLPPIEPQQAGGNRQAAEALIRDIYEDLGRGSVFHGVLFDDITLIAPFADAASGGLGQAISAVEGWQGQPFADFSQELAAILRAWQPALKTARTLAAPAAGDKAADRAFTDNYLWSLEHYDYLQVVPPAALKDLSAQGKWLKSFAATAPSHHPHAINKTIFQLNSSTDPAAEHSVDKLLTKQFDLLQRAGVNNLAYYPDSFLTNQPSINSVRSSLSINTYPALKE